MSNITHFAYSDEAYYTRDHDFGAIAMLSFPSKIKPELEAKVYPLVKSLPDELKWSNLKSKPYYETSIKIFDLLFDYAAKGLLRVDSIIWQTNDPRYPRNQTNSGDKLSVLYYLRLRDTLSKRWGPDTVWRIYVDEHNQMNWDDLESYLDNASLRKYMSTIFGDDYDFEWLRENRSKYVIQEIKSVRSIDEPFIQIADIFAGASAYSHNCSTKLLDWIKYESLKEKKDGCNQMTFAFPILKENKLNSKDKWRCRFIEYLQNQCKTKTYQVSIKECKGLHTFKPASPFNFFYAGNLK